MRRKRDLVKVDLMRNYDVHNGSLVKIDREENGQYYFEIGKEVTVDLAEAVALMMRFINWNDDVWGLEIENVNYDDIDPEKCLYWLTGGKDEWDKLDNYKKTWCDSYLEFQEEFGTTVLSILRKSKNLKDVRVGFLKYLNLPILYNFAINRELV